MSRISNNDELSSTDELNEQIVLIGLVGRKGSGKDTLALHLVESYGYHQLSLAGPMKSAVGLLFNLTDDQIHDTDKKEELDDRYNLTPRYLFQVFGTEVFRESIYDFFPQLKDKIPKGEFWLYHLSERIHKLNKENGIVRFVITDVRFINEAKFLKERFNAKLIRIERDKVDNGNVDSHKSEADIDNITEQLNVCVLKNNGSINDLYEKYDHKFEK